MNIDPSVHESSGDSRPPCEIEPAPRWLGFVVTPGPCGEGGGVWLTDGFEAWPTGGGFFFVPCAGLPPRRTVGDRPAPSDRP